MDKRAFLKQIATASLISSPFFHQIEKLVNYNTQFSASTLASNEDFWAKIRSHYKIKSDYINLENGYYCMLPEPTLDNFLKNVREVNYHASYYMRTVQFENKQKVVNQLSTMAGCNPKELIITRNTTESLDMIIAGFPWRAGDEAIMANQDYGAMLNMFKQVEARHGIVRKLIDIPMNPTSDDEVVAAYEAAITPKTKLLMVCHMVNITGHILPVKKICRMAHSKGVEVMVDGAHAFGHIDFSINDLECDYYGTSLHKWLSVPLGAGFLFVKQEKIGKIWPIFAEDERPLDDISRLNHTGTHPVHTDLTILDAIDYHNLIGIDRKEARLRYLQNYWTNKVRGLDHVMLNTPEDTQRSCAIANVGIKGMESADMAKTLLDKYNIWTVAINRSGVYGCRITPNVYTTTQELDQLVEALKEMGQ